MLHSEPMAAPLDLPIGLPEQRRIHVSEFHRMVEVGILKEDDRVELLEGVLVAMPPMGEPHNWSIQELIRARGAIIPSTPCSSSKLPYRRCATTALRKVR